MFLGDPQVLDHVFDYIYEPIGEIGWFTWIQTLFQLVKGIFVKPNPIGANHYGIRMVFEQIKRRETKLWFLNEKDVLDEKGNEIKPLSHLESYAKLQLKPRGIMCLFPNFLISNNYI